MSVLIFLYLYLMAVSIFMVLAVFLLYHAFKFGTASLTNLITILIFLMGSAFILLSAYLYLSQIDWTQSVKIF